MTKDQRIRDIRDRLFELEPIINKQFAVDPGPAPMTTEMLEAEKLKLELAELQA